jgi:hypothetical protein
MIRALRRSFVQTTSHAPPFASFFPLKPLITGEAPITFEDVKNKVTLIVNVASL